MIRVAIADDHQMFIDGIRALLSLESTIRVVGESPNGKHLLTHYRKWNPDIVLLDINMPEMDGMDCMSAIFEADPKARVIMLTMFKEHGFINQAMQAGAHGYVMKNAGRAELMTAITKVHGGRKHFGEEAIEAYLGQFKSGRKKQDYQKPEEILTKRELEVLKLVSEEFTSQEIADQLFISLHTVETHRKNLMSKLDVKNTVGLARYAIQHGLVELE